ncbi:MULTISPECIES: sigma-70 family RNA polymerase sigma factor [unclassified Streptomyces]|uniref:sigma-70 family RNA polymerase sigma factor n=1 Tax=unclassified Streptomyces TaxID=2593676 RepID=UPI0033BDC070
MAPLIEAARNGDQGAQDALVAAWMPLVYNIVGRALNGHADVDDIVQETMIRALEGLGGLRDPGSFRSWLVAIAMNQIRRRWRDHHSAPDTGALHDAYDVADPGADFVDLTIVRLGLSGQRREVAEATRWLERDDRELLSLWWLEAAGELTRSEVAAAMELSPEHTAVRVQRMKAQLETARLVVRALSAAPRCPELDTLVHAWDGVPSALWRKRVARHARGCAACSGHSSGLVPAEGLLVGLGLVPLAASAVPDVTPTGAMAPVTYGGRPQDQGPGHGPGRGRGRGQAGRDSRRDRRQRSRRRRRALAVILGAAVLGGTLGVIRLWPDTRDGADGGTVRTAAAPESSAPSVPAATKAPKTAPSPSTTPTASPSPSKSASSSPAAPPKSARPSTTPPRPTPSRKPPASSPSYRPSGGGFAQQVTELVNRERANSGCAPVTMNDKLAAAAQGHSEDMAARDYFDHTSPDGSGPGERVSAAGYRWSTYGENIARGQQTPASVVESWMNSPGHRANILNCAFKEIGMGIHSGSGGPWWTQVFGARG